MSRKFITCFCLVALTACKPADRRNAERDDAVEAPTFGQHLSQTIGASDRIEFIEHSDKSDFFDPKTRRRQTRTELIYLRVDLTAAQKTQFAKLANELGSEEVKGVAACIPRPHYTIVFHAHGKAFDEIEICFECMTVRWYGLPPNFDFFRRLEPLMASVGMQPRSDWYQRARQHQ